MSQEISYINKQLAREKHRPNYGPYGPSNFKSQQSQGKNSLTTPPEVVGKLPARELTYPTLGKGKSSSKGPW